ncbi:hypothetical protein [Klenkia terrae]|uniref:Uncharacterized protein n=1 Tax=Klenkia terrae TaxID=1052259 RepID=A0ABU8ECT5_9ACTN|nr:hypothetical protein [Klenkia terrae]
MNGRAVRIAIVAGVVVGSIVWVVSLMTIPVVTMCADSPTGGYCEKQGGPSVLPALATGALTAGVVGAVLWVRQRRR